jgi:hypothetical protein
VVRVRSEALAMLTGGVDLPAQKCGHGMIAESGIAPLFPVGAFPPRLQPTEERRPLQLPPGPGPGAACAVVAASWRMSGT